MKSMTDMKPQTSIIMGGGGGGGGKGGRGGILVVLFKKIESCSYVKNCQEINYKREKILRH